MRYNQPTDERDRVLKFLVSKYPFDNIKRINERLNALGYKSSPTRINHFKNAKKEQQPKHIEKFRHLKYKDTNPDSVTAYEGYAYLVAKRRREIERENQIHKKLILWES